MVQRDKEGQFAEQGRRLRYLRSAEGYSEGAGIFALKIGMSPTQLSNFENGSRSVPRDAALRIWAKVPGFDPIWLWTGEKRGLSFDLRQRIERVEREEDSRADVAPDNPLKPADRNAS